MIDDPTMPSYSSESVHAVSSNSAAEPNISSQSLEDDSGGVQSRTVIFLVMALGGFIIFSVVVSYYFFISYRDEVEKAGIQETVVQELQIQRANERKELSEYGVVDAETGVIRLPIEEGIRKALERYNR